MLGTSERLRVHPLLRVLIPMACAVLCVPMIGAYLRGAPDPTATVVALGSAAVAVAWWVLAGGFALTIDDTGVGRTSPFGERALRWDEIVEYRYAAANAAYAGHMHGALGAMAVAALNKGTLTLYAGDGRRLALGSGWRDVTAAIARIAERLDAVRRQQLASALGDGSPVTFGCITVQRDGLACADKETLPWSELASVQVFAGRLLVKRVGRRRAHFSVRTKALPHFFLLLQILGERGVQVVRERE